MQLHGRFCKDTWRSMCLALPITLHEMRVREDDAAGAGVDADLRPECLTDEIPIWNGSELPIWNGSELQKSQKTSHRKVMT